MHKPKQERKTKWGESKEKKSSEKDVLRRKSFNRRDDLFNLLMEWEKKKHIEKKKVRPTRVNSSHRVVALSQH